MYKCMISAVLMKTVETEDYIDHFTSVLLSCGFFSKIRCEIIYSDLDSAIQPVGDSDDLLIPATQKDFDFEGSKDHVPGHENTRCGLPASFYLSTASSHNQSEFSDLVRDLNLSIKAELLELRQQG